MNAFSSRAISLIVLGAISQPCFAQDTQRRLSPETPSSSAAGFLPEKTANHPPSSYIYSPSAIYKMSAGVNAADSKKAAGPTSDENAAMANRVREEFLHAWNGYKQYAWGHDELKPLSKTSRDWHSVSLDMTPVDALDTMVLMGLNDEANQTREFIAKNLSFDQDIYVKTFEITIRMLGGLLSSYQLTGD